MPNLASHVIMPPTVEIEKGAINVAFVRPSIYPSVRPSVAHIANNSRTQRPSVPKFGRKVPHLRCDSHTNFKIKWSNVRVRGGHTVSPEPGGHTAQSINQSTFIAIMFLFVICVLHLLCICTLCKLYYALLFCLCVIFHLSCVLAFLPNIHCIVHQALIAHYKFTLKQKFL